MSIEKVLYTATATATGGREGHATSSDNVLDVQLSTPRELGGAGGPGTNPEQLFAAGYSACFLGGGGGKRGQARDFRSHRRPAPGPRGNRPGQGGLWAESSRKGNVQPLVRGTA